jgi:hypothetical protein
LAGETELLGENCPRATFVHHKIPHDQTRVWIRAAAVGSRRLTAWAMARPLCLYSCFGGVPIGDLCIYACHCLVVPIKGLRHLCGKPLSGKQKLIPCSVCAIRAFIANFYKVVSACDEKTSTAKSTHNCDSCKTSSEMECTVSPNKDSDSYTVQLEAVRSNGICTVRWQYLCWK